MSVVSQSTPPDYKQERCPWCGGRGRDARAICPACEGKGEVTLRHPARKCSMCGGDGKNRFASLFRGEVCVLCGGSGRTVIFNA